jgi:hypothetical protein
VGYGSMPNKDEATISLGRRKDPMRLGLIGSTLLHGLAALLVIFDLGWLTPAPVERVIPVNLVRLGERTTSPIADAEASLPQAKAEEVSQQHAATAVPVQQTPPSQAAQQQAKNKLAADLSSTEVPQPKPEIRRPIARSDYDALAIAKPHPSPSATASGELYERLKLLAQLRQPAAPILSAPRQQHGSAFSNVTAAADDADQARDPVYAVRDFIRAQVERRWYPDRKNVKGHHWVVRIHIILNPDYTVKRASIIEDPRDQSDADYQDFAISARDAVLLSSPLTLPPGAYDIAKDIIVDFDSQRDLQ